MLPFSISQDRIKRLLIVDIARVRQSQEKHPAKALEPGRLLVCRDSEHSPANIDHSSIGRCLLKMSHTALSISRVAKEAFKFSTR